jgi:RNA-binding protein
MRTLTPAERRALRAKAHHLRPVVTIGQHGLTPGVLHEVDINLTAHELIKIRVFADQRAEREAMLEQICAALDAAWVQHLGKLLIVWRPAPELPAAARVVPAVKTAARKAPQVRRPRTPLPRAPKRPLPAGGRVRKPTTAPGAPKSRGPRAGGEANESQRGLGRRRSGHIVAAARNESAVRPRRRRVPR